MIAFTCQGCGKSFRAGEEMAGRRSRCKHCGAVTTIPVAEIPLLSVAPPPSASSETTPKRASARRKTLKAIDRDVVKSLAIGAGLAAVALAVPPVGLVPAVLMTVIHELGHVATAWLFGCPALPSFDLTYGGGVSHRFTQQPLLVLLVYVAFAIAIVRSRKDRPALVVALVAVGLYSLAAFSPLRELLITAMGHGMELLIAGIFLFRALSGRQVLRGAERPLYAFLGLYILLADARFAYRLITSREHREAYGDAKGGGHWMDFSRIADEQLHVRLESVAALFLFACALAPLAAYLIHRRILGGCRSTRPRR